MKKYSSLGRTHNKNILLKILVGLTCVMGIVTVTQTFRLISIYQKTQTNKEQTQYYRDTKDSIRLQLEEIRQEMEEKSKEIRVLRDELQIYAPVIIPESMK